MLKYAEQFEHDYDNDNYSNYVENVSVHTVTRIRANSRWRGFFE